jgi:hypothetical protein
MIRQTEYDFFLTLYFLTDRSLLCFFKLLYIFFIFILIDIYLILVSQKTKYESISLLFIGGF